ncbi:MAG: C39 family peptidase [Methylobacter sp.]
MFSYRSITNTRFFTPHVINLLLALGHFHLKPAGANASAFLKSIPDRLSIGIKTTLAIGLIFGLPELVQAREVKSLIEMRRHNVVIQQWDLSCGAAALTTLLNYQHGDFVTEKEVANALMNRPEYIQQPGLVTIRQGFSLLDLKRYVDSRGYKGIGYGNLSFDDLLKKAPIIVPINVFGYNHFVIFRGMLGNRVLLADPAWGNRTMLADMFENVRIDFPQIGKVGFVVTRLDGVEPTNRLAPSASEFVMTR